MLRRKSVRNVAEQTVHVLPPHPLHKWPLCSITNLMIPYMISDQHGHVGEISGILMGRVSQVGQRPSSTAYTKQQQSVSKLMLDFTGVHAD